MVPNEIGRLTLFGGVNGVVQLNGPALECRDVRRSKSPIAVRSPRDDVQVEMRDLLAAGDAIVLIEEHSVRIEGTDQRARGTLRRRHYRRAFVTAQIEQRRRMAP